ncbi:MAG: sigma-70 family RNA polymerase sigma factor [Spirochaetia bacterium]|nr:sigma-70 family RNA polymerase sigma factor [Spirochaetia bacterium]
MNCGDVFNDFEKLYLQHYKPVLFYMMRICNHMQTAEDMTQEAFLQARQSFATFNPEKGCFMNWMKTIARNKYYRSLKKTSLCSLDTDRILCEADTRISPERELEDHCTQKILYEAVENLPEPERSIVYYRHNQKLKLDEIAEKIHTSRRTVSRKYINAMHQLRQELKNADILISSG